MSSRHRPQSRVLLACWEEETSRNAFAVADGTCVPLLLRLIQIPTIIQDHNLIHLADNGQRSQYCSPMHFGVSSIAHGLIVCRPRQTVLRLSVESNTVGEAERPEKTGECACSEGV